MDIETNLRSGDYKRAVPTVKGGVMVPYWRYPSIVAESPRLYSDNVSSDEYEHAQAIYILEQHSFIYEQVCKEFEFTMTHTGNMGWIMRNKEGKTPPYSQIVIFYSILHSRLSKYGISPDVYTKALGYLRKETEYKAESSNPKGVW